MTSVATVPHLIRYGDSLLVCSLPELPANLSYGAIPVADKLSIVVVISNATLPQPISTAQGTLSLNEAVGEGISNPTESNLTDFAVNVAGSSWQNVTLVNNDEFDQSPQLHSPMAKTSSDVLLASQCDSNTSRSLLSPGRLFSGRNYSGSSGKNVYFEPNSNQSLNSCYSLGLTDSTNGLATDMLQRTSKPATEESKLNFLAVEPETSTDCPFCGKRCLKSTELTVHMRCHTGQKPYQCVVCGRAFTQNCNVRKHLKTHKVWPHCAPKPTGETTSDICPVSSDNSDPMVFPCPYCELKLESHLAHRTHLKMHKDEKLYQCTDRTCRQLFEELSDLLSHLKCHQLVYKCPTCESEFSSLNDVGLHQLSHGLDDSFDLKSNGDKNLTYRCFHCSRRFASLVGLEKHRASESHIHRCPKCHATLKSGRLLRQHLKKRHSPIKEKTSVPAGSKLKSLGCPECSKRFGRTFLLNRHLATVHRTESRFHCSNESCGKQFKREDKFRTHMLTHTNFKPHTCSHCGKTFGQSRYLKSHIETSHTTDKKFNCQRCQKGFARKILLTKHKCPLQAPL